MNTQSHNGRAIVTYGRSLIALMIAQSLGSRGIDVIGCDDVSMTVLSFSQYVSDNCVYTAAQDNEEQFIDDLVKIVRDHAPDTDMPYVLIPAFRDAKIIARHKDRFDGLITVACPDFDSIDQVDHKDAFARTTQKHNVPSPQTWLPEDRQALQDVLPDITFPVFIKPPDDVGGRGISKIKNADDLTKAFADLQERYPDQQILIQELAKGVDYCFCGLFNHGTLEASMVYHNLEKFPREAGQGVVRETVSSKHFDDLAEQLMKPLQWHGVAGIDFMWDGNDQTTPMMIEVNPRFWAGLDHSMRSNVDFPWLLYCQFTGTPVQGDFDAKIGHKTELPGLASMARIEHLFAETIHLDALEEQWPKIKQSIKDHDLKAAGAIFKDALQDTISIEKAFSAFQALRKEAKESEAISYAHDDPFIGLGVLFILGSLIKHGTLPPEIKWS